MVTNEGDFGKYKAMFDRFVNLNVSASGTSPELAKAVALMAAASVLDRAVKLIEDAVAADVALKARRTR